MKIKITKKQAVLFAKDDLDWRYGIGYWRGISRSCKNVYTIAEVIGWYKDPVLSLSCLLGHGRCRGLDKREFQKIKKFYGEELWDAAVEDHLANNVYIVD